jgi:UPF0755 protein
MSTPKRNVVLGSIVVVSILSSLFAFIFFQSTAPSHLVQQDGITLQIDKGMPVQAIAKRASDVNLVRSSFLLYALLTYSYDPTSIYAGIYRFDEPKNVFEVAKKLASNEVDASLQRITIPEGVTRKEIAKIAQTKIKDFDVTVFLEQTKNNEGYLFPDTYFVSIDSTAEQFVTLLMDTFLLKVAPYKDKIEQSNFSEYEVLILASILEREANDEVSMKMVSGILQNRLEIGMALQTDASIEYVLNKTLQELEPDDLKIDTPYNTYLYPGLTPTPIGNPGLQAIEAVLEPTVSKYMFYITGDDGMFYYAKTFEEHKKNISKYLK